ncbi:PAS domain S-box-containing protein/diguanylate cyclase (GGDEF) domain-containing protein [Marinobacter daqiaonensis]|uniref:diguanylate cyclase n=1 Tax=Marinobacter daqiaonensis TaxID=650891 RepID=A0A1I6JN08_9GAMM|nr:diguanylate cyclase [Marinobacter daqiaonensis]SFR80356.1 PAS domain S-box-containing protein/diguanylate cyclase (GGDEF) domain-containing protein [Marinobacter daqiaonensis]
MLFITALFISCLLTLILGIYAWRRREVPTAGTIAVMMGGLSWWTFFYALQILHVRFPELIPTFFGDSLFWFRVMFAGVVLQPAAFLIFVLQYTGYRHRIGARLILLLSFMPFLTLLAIFSDGHGHQLFMGGFEPGAKQAFRGGPAFWLHSLYSYLIMLMGLVLLIRFAFQNRPYRRQALIFISGYMAVVASNLMTIFNLVPQSLERLDLSPFGFLVAGFVMSLNIRREGFLDLMPVARSLVFERMADAVLVTDRQNRLLDRNPAAQQLFGHAGVDIGRGVQLQQVLPELFENGEPAEELTLKKRHNGNQDSWCLDVRRTEIKNGNETVRGYVYGFRDVTDLKQVEESLRQQLSNNEQLRQALKEESIRDPLTGLFNRRWLDEVLELEIPRAIREESELSLCVIDLDHFKRVNDGWGHDMGDRILVSLAQLLQDESRKHDVVARFGGEEFVLVLPGIGADQAREVIERMQDRFRAMSFGPDGPTNLTFSAGLAVIPGHARDRETLFRLADRGLYRAKEEGRDRLVIGGRT